MAPYYHLITGTPSSSPSPSSNLTHLPNLPQHPPPHLLLTPDLALLEKMESVNKAELRKLDKWLMEAEKTEGESKISDMLKARGN